MAKKSDDTSEEYIYSESDQEEVYTARRANPVKAVLSKFSKQRAILAVVGILVIVYVVFRILVAIENSGDSNKKITKTSTAHKTAQHKTTTQSTKTKTSEQSTQAVHQTVLNHQQHLNNMNTEVANINEKLYNIQESMRQMNGRIYRLEDAVAQQMRLILQTERIEQNRTERKAKHLYRVYAVIPNRAWLFGPTGNTITVKVGSYLPRVGNVIAIDPVSGTVLTNTGARIGFALTDQ